VDNCPYGSSSSRFLCEEYKHETSDGFYVDIE